VGEGAAGRWRRHAPQVRSEKVTVRLTPAERARFEVAAGEAGLRLGGFFVEAARSVADEPGLVGPAAAAGSERELHAALLASSAQLRRYGNNVNQAVVLWHRQGEAPVWLVDAVRLAHGAAGRIDELVDGLRAQRR
jgi:hypothetical protein